MELLTKEFENMKFNLEKLKSKKINELNLSKTMLFIIDMNNGFAKKGALYSDRVEALINPITNLAKILEAKNCEIIAFTDSHNKDSIELRSYPTHCLENDYESKIVDEISTIKNLKVIPKNSTNGFFCLEDKNFKNIDNIIVVGDCTDICIYQFVVTLKAYFNQNNIDKNIIVPMNLVDTYHIDNIHNAEIMNIVFLNSMIQNGVEVIKEIEL
ncbi:isochorismatase family cysteine hydrolase [Paraclostridium sordellii]|uniref:isochorismatase family cysteine hydrolase n=1 Tax=Paraclostridium sordellii TaxID=1505 RepID=UPI0005E4EE76|nr:isochorismatase family cysteine hydrolase [Paeniclostridium sordellii]MDU2687820.1 isochorismatase family cysteine hydrolase [Paeniclostridium sordellii]MDU4414284.1 isochorismatase family cysteine hydrolase [Paeniclostridium sordellii]MDU6249807.1 isochorismatase family cysteine hydrolase [Paeniclostridium sordellii]MDU6480576.1 isochorismatase family cysteine hydrolase [Paeniclostridium sordellii]MRZ29528.1 isochorismatase family protein [Paeniclostridium sordellii]